MLQTTTRKFDVYEVEDFEGKFKMSCELHRIEKNVITLPNRRYKKLIETYHHLKEVLMHDVDEKVAHLLGASDMSRIETSLPAMGWGVMKCWLLRKPLWNELSCHLDKR